jgi:hypothetical protein
MGFTERVSQAGISTIPMVPWYNSKVAGDINLIKKAGSGIICKRIKQSSRISGMMPGTWYIKVRFRSLQKYIRAPTKHEASIIASDHNSAVPKASGVKISRNRKV